MSDAEARARTRAGSVWNHRSSAEIEAAQRFARLGDDLVATRAHSTVIEMARDAAREEHRHVELCRALSAHFGREPTTHGTPLPARGLVTREQVLAETVAVSCVTETLSAAVLGELRERAVDPLVKQTVSEILKDEVKHSRLGWAHLAAEAQRGEVSFVSDRLVDILEVTVEPDLFQPNDPNEIEVEGLLAGYGSLPRAERRALFVATLREVIFPGLERFGVTTTNARAWLDGRP